MKSPGKSSEFIELSAVVVNAMPLALSAETLMKDLLDLSMFVFFSFDRFLMNKIESRTNLFLRKIRGLIRLIR